MSVQTSYGYSPNRGIAGGIYDMYHYIVDSRYNEEENGVLRYGVGVVRGTIPGANVVLPTSASTASDFEGVVVNGFTTQHDLEGKVFIPNNQNVGVMRKGRIWVRLVSEAEVAYGDTVCMAIDGDEAGFFSNTGGVELAGRFIGAADNGLAPIELYGVDVETASDNGDGGGGN